VEGVQPSGGHTSTLAPEGVCLGHGIRLGLRGVERLAPGSQLAGREIRSDPHFTVAVRALPSETLGSARRTIFGRGWRGGEKMSGERQ
jgi:hypothetical protein